MNIDRTVQDSGKVVGGRSPCRKGEAFRAGKRKERATKTTKKVSKKRKEERKSRNKEKKPAAEEGEKKTS